MPIVGGSNRRAVTRFSIAPISEDRWIVAVGRHRNLDRSDPADSPVL
jgi:hypothetical protein